MKKYKKILTFIMLTLCMIFSDAYAAEYKTAIPAEYDVTGAFVNGIAVVYKDGQCGIIDRKGNTVMDFDGRAKCLRANGLIMASGDNGKAAFFDRNANQLTDYIYDIFSYEEPKSGIKRYGYFTSRYDGDGESDLIPVCRGKKFGFINSAGEEQIPLEFDYVYGFYNGMARICTQGELSKYGTYINCKYGLINEAGEVVLPADTYWCMSDFKCGYAAGGNGPLMFMIDRNGKTIDLGGKSFEETNGIYIKVIDNNTNEAAVLDMSGNVVIPFDRRTKELDGEYIILDNKTFVNSKNETVYTAPDGIAVGAAAKDGFRYLIREAGDVTNDVAFGMIDKNFNEILPADYVDATVLGDGIIYAAASLEENFLFNYFGELIYKFGRNRVYQYSDGLFSMLNFDTMKYGYVKNPLLISVLYNEDEIDFADVYPMIEDGRTLVPLRGVFEALGAEISWNDESKTVTASRGECEISITAEENVMYKNREKVSLDVPAKIVNSRMLVPLRAVSEAFGCKVEWDGDTNTVKISE